MMAMVHGTKGKVVVAVMTMDEARAIAQLSSAIISSPSGALALTARDDDLVKSFAASVREVMR